MSKEYIDPCDTRKHGHFKGHERMAFRLRCNREKRFEPRWPVNAAAPC